MSILENNGFLNQFFQGYRPDRLLEWHRCAEHGLYSHDQHQLCCSLGHDLQLLAFYDHAYLYCNQRHRPAACQAAQDLGANRIQTFTRLILPLSLPRVLSGVMMVFIPSVSTFAISRLLGGGLHWLLGDVIDMQFLGGTYNPHLAAPFLIMMVVVLLCMGIMNRFGEGEDEAVLL